MKLVNFQTKCFGLLPEKTVIQMRLLASDGDKALLYAPKDGEGCGCFILAKLKNNIYVDYDDNSYINQVDVDAGLAKFLKAKNEKTKRINRKSKK
jgi:hypothetical protein